LQTIAQIHRSFFDGFFAGLVEEIALTFATKEASLSSAPAARASSTNFSCCVFLRFFEGGSFRIKPRLLPG
jgi:hypothetical protein